jgi:hypothetical protein
MHFQAHARLNLEGTVRLHRTEARKVQAHSAEGSGILIHSLLLKSKLTARAPWTQFHQDIPFDCPEFKVWLCT